MNFKKAVKLSLFLHLSPLLFCIGIPGCGGGSGEGNGVKNKKESKANQNSEKQEILARPKSVDVENVTASDINGYKKAIKKKFKLRNCPGLSYGGIGIQFEQHAYDHGKWIVNLVPDGYPAAKAGIEVGDELIDDRESIIDYRGEIGKEVTVSVKKPDGSIKNFVMLREKICLKEEK